MKKGLMLFAITAMIVIVAGLSLGTVSYDETKSMTRNQVDALIALANATGFEVSLNDVLWVDGDRSDSYTANGSMSAPYKTIAAAKTASASGDVILVAPGAYAETVTLTAGTNLIGYNVTGATLTGNYILFNSAAVSIEGATFTINDASGDFDVRMESDGSASAFFLDAGNNRIGIFNGTPTVPLDVVGNTLITGDSVLDGGLIVNESSADKDTRIESNGSANAIFVDAGNDRVGIFNGTPTVPLDVVGASLFTGAVTVEGGALTFNAGGADYDVAFGTDNDAGTLRVDGGQDAVKFGGFADYDILEISDSDYSLSSTGKAVMVFENLTTANSYIHLMSNLVVSGRQLIFIDAGGNAGSNNITFDTEGSEKINGGDTAVLDANYEQFHCVTNGTDWFCE